MGEMQDVQQVRHDVEHVQHQLGIEEMMEAVVGVGGAMG